MREQQVFLSQATLNLPSNREALTAIPDVLADFARGMEQTTHPAIWDYNEHPLVIAPDAPDGVYRLVIGLYDETNGARLRLVRNGDKVIQADSIELSGIRIVTP